MLTFDRNKVTATVKKALKEEKDPMKIADDLKKALRTVEAVNVAKKLLKVAA